MSPVETTGGDGLFYHDTSDMCKIVCVRPPVIESFDDTTQAALFLSLGSRATRLTTEEDVAKAAGDDGKLKGWFITQAPDEAGQEDFFAQYHMVRLTNHSIWYSVLPDVYGVYTHRHTPSL